jgi:arylsulfatase
MVKFIEASARDGKPFFAYWAPNAPHWPLDAKTADIEKYRSVYDAGPKAIAEARVAKMRQLGILEKDMPWKPPLVIDQLNELDAVVKHSPAYHAIRAQHKARPQDLTYRARVMTEVEFETDGKPRRATSFEESMMVFAAQVDSMDQNIGKVMAKLRELGLYEKTLILFCCDNGASNESHWGTPYSTGNMWAQVSNTPFRRYKKSSFDGGVGTPLIIHWPERIAASAKGSINRTVGHLIDIMPTVLDAAGATYPKEDLQRRDVPATEGRSLLPALDGKQVPLAHPVFIEHDGNCALITEEWKLVADDGRGEGPWSLYNMKTDRCELTDVAAQHPEVVKNLDGQWRAIANRIGARRTGKSDPEWTKEKRNAWWKEYQAQMKRQK